MAQEISTIQLHRRCGQGGPQWSGKASLYKPEFKINQQKWDEDSWERRGKEEEEVKEEEEEEKEEEDEEWRIGNDGEDLSEVLGNADFMSLTKEQGSCRFRSS